MDCTDKSRPVGDSLRCDASEREPRRSDKDSRHTGERREPEGGAWRERYLGFPMFAGTGERLHHGADDWREDTVLDVRPENRRDKSCADDSGMDSLREFFS